MTRSTKPCRMRKSAITDCNDELPKLLGGVTHRHVFNEAKNETVATAIVDHCVEFIAVDLRKPDHVDFDEVEFLLHWPHPAHEARHSEHRGA